jgi:hypothetical protein
MANPDSAVTGVSTAIIVVIVIIAVSCIVSVVAAIWLWVRARSRRQDRLAGFEALGNNSRMVYNNSNNNNYYQSPMAPPNPYLGASLNQNELHGSNPPFRAEAPNTLAPLPQAPNNEVQIEKPYDNSRAELGPSELDQPEPLRPVQSSQPMRSEIKPSELPG